MDSLTLAITDHRAHAQLAAMEKWLGDVKGSAMEEPEFAAEWTRLNRVLDLVKQRLASSDPVLIPLQTMEGILSSTTNIVGQLSTYDKTPSLTYLEQANKHGSDLLFHALLLPGTEFKKARKSMLSYMGDYAAAVKQHTKELEERTQEGMENLSALQVKVTDLETQAKKQATDALAVAKVKDEEFEKAQDAREEAFEASETERATQLLAAEKTRNEALAADLKQHLDELEALLAAKTEEADLLRDQIKKEAEGLISELQGFKVEAGELVGLTGTLTRANAYREAAKDEGLRGWIWSGVAAGALLALSIVAFKTLWTYTNSVHPLGIDWSGFSIRVYTLFALTALAFYAGRQGEIHKNAERQNRRLFSDLASISPFLSDIDSEKRQAIIEEIARRIFGQPETPTEPMRQSPLLTPEQIGKGYDLLVDAAGKTLKKL